MDPNILSSLLWEAPEKVTASSKLPNSNPMLPLLVSDFFLNITVG